MMYIILGQPISFAFKSVGNSFSYNILVGKPEGKRPLGRPRHRWEDNIRMDLREMGWECVWTSNI